MRAIQRQSSHCLELKLTITAVLLNYFVNIWSYANTANGKDISNSTYIKSNNWTVAGNHKFWRFICKICTRLSYTWEAIKLDKAGKISWETLLERIAIHGFRAETVYWNSSFPWLERWLHITWHNCKRYFYIPRINSTNLGLWYIKINFFLSKNAIKFCFFC